MCSEGTTTGINPADHGMAEKRHCHFALLITWTCYGTWLPGDRRGYVSNTRHRDGTFERKRNAVGAPYTANHCYTRTTARLLQKHETARLRRDEARVAAEALVEACIVRGWRIPRAALMSNHVHVVVTDCPDIGPAVRRVLKGVSQTMLSKCAGDARRWWTAGGSDRYLHGDRAICAALRYVAKQAHKLAEIIDMQVREVV